ncbi:MAG: acyl carrier protein, partial [Lachnospiraceae bacterium]|nr:acyl carrier protein [Lachnospiraceae bacterium]
MEEEILKQIIAEVMKVDPREIEMDTTLIEDLGADSIDILQLLLTIEEENGIIIPDEKLATFACVADIVAYLETL